MKKFYGNIPQDPEERRAFMSELGRRGGLSRSLKKIRAVRLNGRSNDGTKIRRGIVPIDEM